MLLLSDGSWWGWSWMGGWIGVGVGVGELRRWRWRWRRRGGVGTLWGLVRESGMGEERSRG